MTTPPIQSGGYGSEVTDWTGTLTIVDTGYVDLPLFGIRAARGGNPQTTTDRISAGQRLTLKQHAAVAAGIHPLTKQQLHPDAPDDTSPTDRYKRPFTCGTCQFRQAPWGYPKCFKDGGDGARITSGPTSDVRAWWPACPDYEQKDGH